jgi:hypothetical protein
MKPSLAKLRTSLALRRFYAGRDRAALGREISAIVITVDPNPLYERCLASVRAQSIMPHTIEIVRNEMPASKASQVGLERIETPYYLSVDGDMVLHPTCIERLYFEMQRHENCAEALATLIDPYLGEITGVRLYRTEPVRAIGFYPLRSEKGHDRFMTAELARCGYQVVNCRSVQGLHHPVYTADEAFWKFRVMGEKLRHYPSYRPTFEETTRRLMRAWTDGNDEVALVALAGLFEGLESEDTGAELTYEGRAGHEGLRRLTEYLEAARARRAGG